MKERMKFASECEKRWNAANAWRLRLGIRPERI